MIETKVARYGNSLTVRLPAALARELDLREGDRVTLQRVEQRIVLERDPRSRLEARLATVRGPESEIGTGTIGAETIE